MALFTDEIIRDLLAQSLKAASHDGQRWNDAGEGPDPRHAQYIDWLRALHDLVQRGVGE
jgi:carbonic anhydrase